MARLGSVGTTAKGLVHEYGGWIVLIITAYILFSFRKVFSGLGDAAGAKVEAAVANAKADADAQAQKVKAQAATGTKTNFSAAQVATFEADARALAGFLGQLNLGLATVFKDQGSAFSLIKQKYSRLNLYNNKPFKWKDANRKTIVPQTAETAASVKNPTNYKVLIPFYKDATNGRDLVSDFRYYVTGSGYKEYLKWIL